MRVLLVHNSYLLRAGEDVVFEAERDLLRGGGHEVIEYRVHNEEVASSGALRLAAGTVWSRTRARELRELVAKRRPDVAHFHNTLPLISPAGYYAVRRAGVPVVQTLHNYRLLCPSALLFRDGHVCEDCVGRKLPWPAVRHACYRQSRTATAAVAAMLVAHRALGTYSKQIDVYVAMTRFARAKFIEGGLPAGRIAVKPNCIVDDPGVGSGPRRGVLFVGRLAAEKGVPTLLDALDRFPAELELRVVGDGPLAGLVAQRAARDPRLRYDGLLDRSGVLAAMREAAALAFTSEWYEGANPVTIVEAFASGCPVVCCRIGGMATMIEDEVNGLHVAPRDPAALAGALTRVATNAGLAARLSAAGRRDFEDLYTGERTLALLERIYALAIEARRTGGIPELDDELRGERARGRREVTV